MSILAFQMPEKVVMEKADDFHGLFTFKPLEQGYGVTVGNALRRILLSSLEGYAITGIKIPGVLHEFSSIEGVREDVTDIVLNVKAIAVRMHVECPKKMRLSAEGPCEVTAGMIEAGADIEIMNPDLVICTLDKLSLLVINSNDVEGNMLVITNM